MQRRYVAFLRAITNVGMQPFRNGLEELGFSNVESYGASGNLLFDADASDTASLERRIAARLDAVTMVRTRRDLARIVAQDPFGSTIMFLARAPAAARCRALLNLPFDDPSPVLYGKHVFLVFPARLRGKRTPFDLEGALGVQGTLRTARVVRQLLARL